jgi:adenine-specific DNA-methyltransferase
MDEVNACIAAHAEQDELVDKPEIVRGVVRVSGPFTMEAVMPIEESLTEETPIGGAPAEALETFGSPRRESGEGGRRVDEAESSRRRMEAEGSPPGDEAELASEPANAEPYLDKMLRLLKADGVRFPNNKVAKFSRLEALDRRGVPACGGGVDCRKPPATTCGGVVWAAVRASDGVSGRERAA